MVFNKLIKSDTKIFLIVMFLQTEFETFNVKRPL